eukprot:scpid99960/ scgid21842/ 
MPYIMKEYAGGGSTPQQQYYGLQLCKSRMVIECSFGRLKARFAALRRAMDINMDDLPHVIYACFVLHNFCEYNGESLADETVQTAIADDHRFQPPHGQNPARAVNDVEGKRVRRVLTKYFDP